MDPVPKENSGHGNVLRALLVPSGPILSEMSEEIFDLDVLLHRSARNGELRRPETGRAETEDGIARKARPKEFATERDAR